MVPGLPRLRPDLQYSELLQEFDCAERKCCKKAFVVRFI
jgi:hypothetical protein